jgi:predicted CXXCH cytochrome family protein
MTRNRTPLLAGTILLFSLIALPGAAGAKTFLIYPRDGTAVSEATITLLGAVDSPSSPPVLALGEQPLAPAVKPNGVFSIAVRLQPGLNLFTVDGQNVRVDYLGKGQPLPIGFVERFLHPPVLEDCGNCHEMAKPGDFSVSDKVQALCTGCHDDPVAGKEGKRKAVVHSPIADGGDCLACHDPHVGDTKGMNTKPQPGLCYDCHDKVTGRAHDHAPAAAGDCTACHDPHAAPFARLVREKGQGLCLKCHKDPTADPKMPSRNLPHIHDALDEGCLACHDPHGSDQKGVLRKPQLALCGECHDQGAPGKGIVVHSPIADDRECTGCHRPHAGPLPRLLTSPVPALCGDCHDAVAAPKKQGDKVHDPVAKGACLACHSPHAGPGRMLAKKPSEVCLSCHPRLPLLPGGSLHSPVAEGDCQGCHRGHSGPGKLLQKPAPALCLDCHDDVGKKGDGKKFALVHSPVEEGACLDCHTHHFSPNPSLLNGRGNALCLNCHDDPGLTPQKTLWPSTHPPVQKKCLSCHFAHASDQKGMLRGPVFNLCAGCHRTHKAHILDATEYIEERVSGMVHIPETFPLTDAGKMVCTGCHLPHGGREKSLLVIRPDRLCAECHPE